MKLWPYQVASRLEVTVLINGYSFTALETVRLSGRRDNDKLMTVMSWNSRIQTGYYLRRSHALLQLVSTNLRTFRDPLTELCFSKTIWKKMHYLLLIHSWPSDSKSLKATVLGWRILPNNHPLDSLYHVRLLLTASPRGIPSLLQTS